LTKALAGNTVKTEQDKSLGMKITLWGSEYSDLFHRIMMITWMVINYIIEADIREKFKS